MIHGDEWRDISNKLSLQYREVAATRGNILSDNGSLLATSLPFYRIAFDPTIASEESYQKGIDSLSYFLAGHFGDRSQTEYKRRINDARIEGRKYLILNRARIDYQDKKEMQTWPIFRNGRMGGGVIFEKIEKRFLPFSYLANRTIGYVNENDNGAGLEYSFNSELSGKDGRALYQKVSGGNWKPVFDGSEVRPQDGYDLVTTIDVNLQDVAEDALLSALEKHRADYGSVLVMEVKTGEIKAISNLGKTKSGKYAETYNYAVGGHGLREPGSTFKLVTMLSLLEETNLSLEDSIDTHQGELKIYDEIVRDHEEGGYGKLTVKEAFEYSSNVAMAKLADQYFGLKPEKFYGYLEDLKITQPIGFQLVGEGIPKVRKPEDWSGISLAWMSHGYGLELTPLHTLTLYNAIANDGKMIKPIIVKSLNQADRVIESYKTEVMSRKICSDKTLEKLKLALEGVVENGTATNIKTDLYKIAGKTGTAVTLKKGRYRKEYYTSFVGYFPAEKPLYSCIVVVENPRSIYKYGNNVAAPVFKEISDKIYSIDPAMQNTVLAENSEVTDYPLIRSGNIEDLKLICDEIGVPNVAKSNEKWVKTRIHNDSIVWRNNKMVEGLMPDVTGMTLRDALYLLENKGLKVDFNGIGRVTTQSISPGVRIKKGNHVKINLS